MKNDIIFYMVPSSPWSFLSFNRIEKICNSYKLKLNLIPLDIFHLFEMNNIKMLSQRPLSVQKNRLNELQRWKDHLNIIFNIKPKFFPVNSIKACQLIISTSIIFPNDKDISIMLAKSLSEAVWVKDLNIDDSEVIFEILGQLVNDKDFENIKNTFHKEKTSSILKDNTIEAFKKNIFGVPSFIFNNQIFWGQDRIFFLEKEISKIYA